MKARTKKLCLAALLAGLALILFVVEAQIPPLTAVPGIKPGLSNIVTVFALYALGPHFALAVLLCRIFLGSLITGQVSALLFSLAGGLLAFGLCALLRPLIGPKQLWVNSTLGAVAHNLGQILAAIAVTRTPALLAYFPVLCLAGLICGIFTGLCAQTLLGRLHKLGLVPLYAGRAAGSGKKTR